MIGDTATVLVDGEEITGTVYHVRDNGWQCVETETGRIASGPSVRWFYFHVPRHIAGSSGQTYIGKCRASIDEVRSKFSDCARISDSGDVVFYKRPRAEMAR